MGFGSVYNCVAVLVFEFGQHPACSNRLDDYVGVEGAAVTM